ncbi:MAG TPA: M20/M25/M40 family metallo-hydrolase, partial [Pirellulaceae bacterium]|nr:M20/M25/M40 family metallo-hydrolase [Pirellulaceae bacterium]
TDPELKSQYIVIGAHYDHVGYGSRTNSFGPTGYIHNGADDNASGVAGLLEIIQAFTSLPEHPRRSVLFALWDGEEKGLLGSKHWLRQPTLPVKNVVLYINLDMIGRLRNQRVEVYGTRTASGLRSLVSRQNVESKLMLDFTWEMKENSDHYCFFERSVPTLMFHTGLHDNYHRPSDDTHLINNDGIAAVARLTFQTAFDVADSPAVFKFRNESRREDPPARRAFEQTLPAPGPRFGLEWTYAKPGERGVIVAKVTPGLPAQQAGLKPGDRLLKFQGDEVTTDAALRKAVLAAKAPAEVEVERAGETAPLTLSVPLAGSPTRVGIAWKDDPAEPGSALLTQVVYGSAAHQAGLHVRDRIYEVAGQKFANSDEFLKLVTTMPSPLELLVERAGVIQRFNLELPSPAPTP